MILSEQYTDEWGVTYCNNGRVLKEVDSRLFTCEEYTVPEGVEIMEDSFWLTEAKLRKVRLPGSLRKMECNTFIRCPLEELALPEGLTEIPDYMCESCEKLKKVVIPSTIKCIRIGAFNCCSKLQEVDLPDGIEYMEHGVFRFCESLRYVKLPSKLRCLSDELFYCSGLESIDIHDNISEIYARAFWGCDHLKRLSIPETVVRIEAGIVTGHVGFEGIECQAKGYHVENDALINDEKHELLCCWTQQKHYVVPENVKSIADIGGNPFVESITVKQPVELTTYEPFASDMNLRRVDFQGGVSGITDCTFWNCPKLEQIFRT